ncbi:hypothetical protein LAT59_00650 [Candidatus Gracilibacteria bacterium]|nr:hypothetical protein [Candidatus Gracilibacteria bacterium]
MATSTQDDLLIIEDETDRSNDDFSFNFEFNDADTSKEKSIEDNTEAKEAEIKAQDDVSQDDIDGESTGEIIEIQDEDETIEINQDSLEGQSAKDTINDRDDTGEDEESFSIDLGVSDDALESIDNEVVEDIAEKKENESEGIGNIINLEDDENIGTSSVTEVEKTEDLNTILSGTIAKLQGRKESIENDTAAKKKKAGELRIEIEGLEGEVSTIEAEIAALGLESDKIDTNISQLEGMKLDPVKEHNAKRVSKK